MKNIDDLEFYKVEFIVIEYVLNRNKEDFDLECTHKCDRYFC